ncbi:serine/threonine protein phosphatase [Paenibacillus algorifonticola]|uniref:PP2C family protein-serine/threonine phosphatase n=1 Tax=Paenibacillus algorifonticola TaxID=684063 RepID=UPI003D2E59F0
MRKENSSFKTDFLSEAGTFMENRDYFAYVELDDRACWIVADGCDNDVEVRSAEMAVQCLLENFTHKPTMSKRKLESYLQEAQDWLRLESRRVRLKVSLIMVVTDYTRIVWAVAGNARLYHFRGGRLLQQSKDLSLAQAMADRESISSYKVDRHEERHNLLQYVGKPEGLEPFISKKTALNDGDVLLLVTPGMWESVDVPEMLDSLEDTEDPTALVDTLEEVLLSKQQPVIGNYTAAAIYVDKVYKEDKKKWSKWVKRIALVMIPVIIAAGFAIYYKSRTAARMAESLANMLEYEQTGDTYVEERNYAQALKSYSEARAEAKKLKDKVHIALYGVKYKKVDLIVAGDGFLKEGDYEKALTQYKKAKEETKNDGLYDQQELDQKISQIDEYVRIAAIVQEADLKAEGQDYSAAVLLYKQARKAALNVGFVEGEKEIKTKLDEAEAKIAELVKEQKLLKAENLEKRGDRSFAAGNYEAAIDAYTQAQAIYQEIAVLEPVLKLERSIGKAEDKLNPVPSPAAGGDAGTGDGGGAGNTGTGSGANSDAGGSSAGSGNASSSAGNNGGASGSGADASGAGGTANSTADAGSSAGSGAGTSGGAVAATPAATPTPTSVPSDLEATEQANTTG